MTKSKSSSLSKEKHVVNSMVEENNFLTNINICDNNSICKQRNLRIIKKEEHLTLQVNVASKLIVLTLNQR